MAGDPTPVVNNWILDYFTYLAWEEFKLDSTLSSSTLDSIAGILSRSWEGDEQGNDKKLFLTVLSRLKDGEDIEMRYDETSEMTPLEDLVPHFMNLVNLQIEDKLQNEGELLLKVIKCEAVQACCRAGEFEKAKEVFDKLFQHHSKDKVAKTLKRHITKKNKEPDLSYTDFITAMVEYLEQIADSFEEPTIITAAKLFIESKPCGHSLTSEIENEGADRIPRREVIDSVQENSSDNNSVTRNRRKLLRLWNNKMKEIFDSDGSTLETNDLSANVNNSPFKEQPTSNGVTPKRSKHKKVDSADSRSPFKKPVTTEGPVFKTPTPKDLEPVHTRKNAEKASTSRQITPGKAHQVSHISPVKKITAAESSEEDSPALQYSKNKGRSNRHEPVMSSTRCETQDDDSDMEVSSVCSMTSKRKWTEDEMLDFYDAVQTFGVGRWAQMKNYLNTSRTNVMLKDKWRNMVKSGDVDRIRERRKKKKVK